MRCPHLEIEVDGDRGFCCNCGKELDIDEHIDEELLELSIEEQYEEN